MGEIALVIIFAVAFCVLFFAGDPDLYDLLMENLSQGACISDVDHR
jgi:hypothetical protein